MHMQIKAVQPALHLTLSSDNDGRLRARLRVLLLRMGTSASPAGRSAAGSVHAGLSAWRRSASVTAATTDFLLRDRRFCKRRRFIPNRRIILALAAPMLADFLVQTIFLRVFAARSTVIEPTVARLNSDLAAYLYSCVVRKLIPHQARTAAIWPVRRAVFVWCLVCNRQGWKRWSKRNSAHA